MIQEAVMMTDGRAVNVASGGEGCPAVLLLHGVTRNWRDFCPFVNLLAKERKILAIDFRGHGNSEFTSGEYAVIDYCRDAVAIAKALSSQPLIVYGHSLGAMVALAVAAELPNQVRAVVLEDPPFDTMGSRIALTPLLGYFQQLNALARKCGSVAQLAEGLAEVRMSAPGSNVSTRLGDVRDATTLLFAATCLAKVDPGIFEPIVNGTWLHGYDRASLLSRVTCPVLLLQGNPALGGMLIDEDADEIERRCACCTRKTFGSAGHHIHWQEPDETVRLIRAFLDSHLVELVPKPPSRCR